MTEKPSRNEEEYFARRDAEILKARREAAEAAAKDSERRSHFMKCPKCGANLATEDYHGVQIDRCKECLGIWFDAGEAESLIKQESGGGLGSLFKSIARGVRST
jgi:hypothetical protein